MTELEDQWPEAGADLDRIAGPAFDALANWFEEHADHQGEIWTVDWPTRERSHAALRPEAQTSATTSPTSGGATAAGSRGDRVPDLRSAVLEGLRGEEIQSARHSLEARLHQALLEWVPRRVRPVPWILDYCVRRFQERRAGQLPGVEPEPLRLSTFASPISYEDVPPKRPRAYRPAHETRTDYKAYIEEYMSQREAAYERAGWELAPERRIRSGRDADERRLRWLVKNVLGFSYEDLERSGEGDKGTIGREIRQIAEDLHLELNRKA